MDNPPAFPRITFREEGDYGALRYGAEEGMSLRDWFAGQMDVSGFSCDSIDGLAQFIGEEVPEGGDIKAFFMLSAKFNAKVRYMLADAMLAERSK